MTKSLKTFFLYSVIVLLVIVISLSFKTYQIVKNSIFDGKNQFLFVETKGLEVKHIFLFDPESQDISVVQLIGKPVVVSSLGKTLGLIPNTMVLISSDFESDGSPTKLLTEMALKKQQFETNMTLYDTIRLLFLAQNKELTMYKLQLPRDQQAIDSVIRQATVNETIVTEDNTIQILNASGVPGIATRLERALTNRGANVLSVKTSHSKEAQSTIKFYGEETETVKILKSILMFPVEVMEKESVAKIIITIGEDGKDSAKF